MPLRYATPWRQIFDLGPSVAAGTRGSQNAFSAGIVARMSPPPRIEGSDWLPEDPRFVIVANHYQRKGMWIAHPASAITQAVAVRFGHADPILHWLVTANWPPWRIGPWRLRSPGDILLPRVAHALWCYPVAIAGTNPSFTAASIRRLLRDLPKMTRPLGLFPEGVAGLAGRLSPPLPGVDRLIRLMAKSGWAFVPVGIAESDRLVIRFGLPVSADEVGQAADPAAMLMERIARQIRAVSPA